MSGSQLCSTTCPYCGVGCGIDVKRADSGSSLSELTGQSDHPANFGRLCVKGSHLLETLGVSNRMLHPRVDGSDVSWTEAIVSAAAGFRRAIDEYGPDSVAFYVSGQLLTEDYYVANKLMKGFIGSANIDTNSRLCMSSAVAAYKRAFGADAVPCNYEDLETTDFLVIIGSNAAWTHPVLFQRIDRAKKKNPNLRIIVIDPRRTQTCEIADQHLAIKPGSDAALFLGLINFIASQDAIDAEYVEKYTQGIEDTLSSAEMYSLNYVSQYCGVDKSELVEFYRGFTQAKTAVTFYSMGINQSTSGVDKANAIINCHLATGKIGKPGCGPFSITGQPNAMGGREVGGLANMLAAHMDINNSEHRTLVKTFWQSPTIARSHGLKAVDLFDAIEAGKIKAVWIMATNPVVSMPNRNKIESALSKCPLVVVSDVVSNNDTLKYADIAFPATAWSEKDGTVTNSERRISRQRGLLPATGEARHDWQIICDVAKAMGYQNGFNFSTSAEIFDEHANLSAYQNNGTRDFDLSGLCGLSQEKYNLLKPIQWPVNQDNPEGTARLFLDGKFFTSSGKAQFIAIQARHAEQTPTSQYPWVLNTGRIRDQWHTMTRTSQSNQLNQHIDEPFLAMNPEDMVKELLAEGQLVCLASAQTQRDCTEESNQVVLRVQADSGLRRGQCFAPIHWSQTNSSAASIAPLFSSANDPISGQPELKHAAIAINALTYRSHAQVFCKAPLPEHFLKNLSYWCVTTFENGLHYRIASSHSLLKLIAVMQPLIMVDAEVLQRGNASTHQLSVFLKQQLVFALFAHDHKDSLNRPHYSEVNSEWLSHLFSLNNVDEEQQAGLLRIHPDDVFTLGKVICSCFKVREKTIVDAINSDCQSVEALGQKLQCGTNCGSCKTELNVLIKERKLQQLRSLQSIDITIQESSNEAVQP